MYIGSRAGSRTIVRTTKSSLFVPKNGLALVLTARRAAAVVVRGYGRLARFRSHATNVPYVSVRTCWYDLGKDPRFASNPLPIHTIWSEQKGMDSVRNHCSPMFATKVCGTHVVRGCSQQRFTVFNNHHVRLHHVRLVRCSLFVRVYRRTPYYKLTNWRNAYERGCKPS